RLAPASGSRGGKKCCSLHGLAYLMPSTQVWVCTNYNRGVVCPASVILPRLLLFRARYAKCHDARSASHRHVGCRRGERHTEDIQAAHALPGWQSYLRVAVPVAL